MQHAKRPLGLAALIAIVFSSMIGAGIYNIPQNMAKGAALAPTLLSWIISGAGILFLVLTFKILSRIKPDLNAGIYQYAQEGFGNYIGFNVAWGYWLCAAMGNVALAVMLNDSLGYFFPILLAHGWESILFMSALIWGIFLLLLSGIREAAFLNLIVSAVKFLSLSAIIILMIAFFRLDMLSLDFWGETAALNSFGSQIRSTMLVTLWCFIGVEGAVVIGERAKNSSDIGKASVFGFLLALILYMLISILSFGIMSQSQLSNLPNPSVAYVLESVIGKWGLIYVLFCVVISILGGWLSWTILCVQVPFTAAQVKILPKRFLKENKKETPVFSLLVSSVLMQIFILLVATAESVYMVAIEITGVMILPAYFFCGLYLLKLAYKKDVPEENKKHLTTYRLVGILSSAYCLWLLYAGGLSLLLITSIAYIAGLIWYIEARRENKKPGEKTFSRPGFITAIILIVAAFVSLVALTLGWIII
ncbi:MAG: basic amino acid/polyamine antiporter [Bacteroidales bacterium]